MRVRCIDNKGCEERFTIGKVYTVYLEHSNLNDPLGVNFYCILNTDIGDSFTQKTSRFEIVEDGD